MKNLILSIGLLCFSLPILAQNDCKCFEKTYEIIGDVTYENGNEKYYAGIKDDIVYFTFVQYAGEKVSIILTYSISTKVINLSLNDMFGSKSKTETKDGYTELTLGSSLMDKRNLATHETRNCYLNNESIGYSQYANTVILGRFADKAKIVELTDKIKAIQGK